ncbi:hypothetical protein [Streptomyces sp. NPDC005752]|uniref:hypothetical protein n=1 Tax=Streptomyces sp. NPDC005752 TaxID=3157065 RepID=UPI00340E9DE8
MLPRQIEGNPVVQSTILSGSKDVKEVGAEAIGGTRTTHYRGTVPFDGLREAQADATDKASRDRRTDSLDSFMALQVDETLTMDLWIDEDGSARQFRMRCETLKARYNSEGLLPERVFGDPLDMTVTFLEINQPVTVKAPPDLVTADLGALVDAHVEGEGRLE